jgi:hypothetical protein
VINDCLDKKVTHLPHLESTYDWAQYLALPVIPHKGYPLKAGQWDVGQVR